MPRHIGGARRSTMAMLLACAAAAAAGCATTPRGTPPRDASEALERVNSNLAQIRSPIQGAAFVSLRFRDRDGEVRRFLMQDARVMFAPARSLRFEIVSLAGTVAQFGSNDERYWVYVEPQTKKIWWGRWDSVDRVAEGRSPIPADQLLDALLLRPLPATLAGGLNALLRVDGADQRLGFVRLNASGQAAGWREVKLDPNPPYMPTAIIDWLANGVVAMRAELSKYAPLGDGGPLTPRRYVIEWPQNEAELRIDITRLVTRPDLPPEAFEFPEEFQGQMEQIDAAARRPEPAVAGGARVP